MTEERERDMATGSAQQRGGVRRILLISFLLLTIIPVIIISAVTIWRQFLNSREQIINQLDSVAALKETQMVNWADSLRTDLSLVFNDFQTQFIASRIVISYYDEYSAMLMLPRLLETMNGAIDIGGRFEEIFLMDDKGVVVLSTDSENEGKIYDTRFFREGLKGTYVQPPFYSAAHDEIVVVASIPLYDEQGQVVGVLAGIANLNVLNAITQQSAGLGETGETYLVDSNYLMLTKPRFGEEETEGDIVVQTTAATEALAGREDSGLYQNYADPPALVLGVYRWIPELEVALIAEQEWSEAFSATFGNVLFTIGIAGMLMLVVIMVALSVTRNITVPLVKLTDTAARVAAGDLSQITGIKRDDEIGILSEAFDAMTIRLRELFGQMEERVAERTAELERRTEQMQIAAEVSRAASGTLNMLVLMQQIVDMICESFDLYYAGIFLVDEGREYAWLRAGTGEAGEIMLAQRHKLAVDESSMIGWCVKNAQARIALDVGEEAVRFSNPLLPDTRSEMALPLIARDEVIGAITIQSDQPSAFSKADITILQNMADQIANAIGNALAFERAEQALQEARRIQRRYMTTEWSQLLAYEPKHDYEYTPSDVGTDVSLEEQLKLAIAEKRNISSEQGSLALPIALYDRVIGAVGLQKTGASVGWSQAELALIEAVANQMSLALENLQLFESAQRRAAQERQVREITEKMRATTDMESLLRTTVQELARTLGVTRSFVQLKVDESTEQEKNHPTD